MFGRRGARGTRPLSAATWNIRHGWGADGSVDLERVARVLRSLEADIVGLQELDRGWSRSGRVDQPARLAELTGMEIVFRATVAGRAGEYGLAIASTQRVAARFEPLPGRQNEEPRGVIVARTHDVSVLVTHLSRHAATRRLQVGRLAGIAREVAPPVLLLGDLNQGRAGLGPLRRAGLAAPRRRIPSVPAARPVRQIDHVLAGRGARVEKVWVVRTDASDHLPLVGSLAVTRINN